MERLKKINVLLNTIMGSCFGVFLGLSGSIWWEHYKYPELYAMRSAPWYTGILLHGACLGAAIFVCAIIKFFVKRKMRKMNDAV